MIRSLVISFDLDGTLLCDGNEHLADLDIPTLLSPTGVREDRMRRGAIPLLRGLAADGHQIWIYTQSLRGRSEVMGRFGSLGISLAGYVNLQLHETACEQHGVVGRCPRKSPHWFGIDVHVDECRVTSCRVILVKPEDVEFEANVRAALSEIGR